MRWIEKYRWWWLALSGLLLVLSMAPFSCAPLGWIALVPAWWVVTRSEHVRQHPIRYGYLLGLIYFGGVFWWIGNVTVVGVVFLIFYTAVYPGIWFLLIARLLWRGQDRLGLHVVLEAIAAACFWVLLEWWRSWLFTGYNWDEIGDSQAPSIIFRQLAAYGGVHLISFVLVAVNVLWAESVLAAVTMFNERRAFRPSVALCTGLLTVAISFALCWHHLQRHHSEQTGPELRFACIQPNIPQIPYAGEPWESFQDREDAALMVHVDLSMQAIADHPDLIIWPEATIDEGVFDDRSLNEAVHAIGAKYDGYFLLGSQDFDRPNHKLYNAAYLFWHNADLFAEYRKTRLVVVGEYLPLGTTFPWLRKALGIGMDFTPGPEPKKFDMEKPKLSFAPLICFEDTLSEVADQAAALHPDFFVTITNDGWYSGWCGAWGLRQHLNHALFRCVEHDLPMIRCGNNGVSCLIDENGTVVDRLLDGAGREVDVRGIFARTLTCHPTHPTLHEAWGDWIILLSALISAMLCVPFFHRLLRPRES